jgi:hypothetical protein
LEQAAEALERFAHVFAKRRRRARRKAKPSATPDTPEAPSPDAESTLEASLESDDPDSDAEESTPH